MSNTETDEWKKCEASVIESSGGAIAVVITTSSGRNPARKIKAIRKDGTPSKKEAYWIKSRSTKWQGKGSCMMHHRSQQGYLEYYFTDFDLWETKPSQNSERIMRTYEVLADHHVKLGWFRSRIEERTILVQAESADEAKSIVAGDRVGFGLSDFGFVRAARPHKAD